MLFICSVHESKHTTMTALQQFGAEMLKLSRGLESVGSSSTTSPTKSELSSGLLLPFPHMPLQKQNSLQQYSLPHHHQQFQMHHHQHLHHQLQLHTTSNQQQLSNGHKSSKHPEQQQEHNLFEQQKFIKNHEYRTITASSSLTNPTKPFLPAMNFSQDFKTRKR